MIKRHLDLESIRIGTLVPGNSSTPSLIRQLVGHAFESFQISFWQGIGATDLSLLASEVGLALGDSGAVISCLGVYGNPLSGNSSKETLRSWEACIDHAEAFGTDMVCGFAGRIQDRPIPESIPRFAEVFGPLAKRASDCGVRIAFENCWMGGDWKRGDWNIATSPEAWELMFDALPNNNLGLEWEPCHQLCQLIEPLPQLRTWVPKIFHVHGKDATVYWDLIRTKGFSGSVPPAHHRHPGFGDSNWTDIISELRRFGYKGSIDIEGYHDPVYSGHLETTGQIASLNYLRRCRGDYYIANPTL